MGLGQPTYVVLLKCGRRNVEMQGQEIILAVRAVSEKHLQTILPGLDNALVGLDNAVRPKIKVSTFSRSIAIPLAYQSSSQWDMRYCKIPDFDDIVGVRR
ncbi:hypothetical protein C5L14_13195 [Labrys okinawensis]|uniref:Uncharacterized protein n=1 Tax=Labrys okinawensis TaxID=346911 RepID=A0A2S9QDY2_9HYPH|nr:hypothetical protein C5L14_13195 [Labrys okinawensis]